MNRIKRQRVNVRVDRNTRFTVQDMADFVAICAERDMDPSTPVTFYVLDRAINSYQIEAEGPA